MKIGINGLGRIGRNLLKIIAKDKKFTICNVNDLSDNKTIAHLLKYDSTHGISDLNIQSTKDGISINNKNIPMSHESDPKKINWDKYGVQIVLECTGKFIDAKSASSHISKNMQKVIVSAPCKNADSTIIMGINNDDYNPKSHKIISGASCTTHCLAPIIKIFMDNYGIKSGSMTTVHSYTLDQNLLDYPNKKKDLRRIRAACLSIVPTSTGAIDAIADVFPKIKNKLSGFSVRVPVPNVSLIDLVLRINKKNATIKEINNLFKKHSKKKMQNILSYNDLELVSSDFNGSKFSSIFDASFTQIISDDIIKIVAWYDNEIGYSYRLKELLMFVAKNLN